MIPGAFEFHAVNTVQEALKLLNAHEDAKIIAGGHSLLPMMKLRFAEPTHLIDINGIPSLKGITEEGDSLYIGAMTNENELIRSELLQRRCPLLIEVAKLIADPQIRNRGTIGGDIAHGDPGNDHPAVMMALDAEFVIQSEQGERVVPANGFFLGTYWTGLEDGELISSIRVPAFAGNTGFGFHKLKRKTGDFATAAATVVLGLQGDRVEHIRIAMTNVGPCAFRAEAAEKILLGNSPSDALIQEAALAVQAACEPVKDLSGDEEYKAAMAAEMMRRALHDALQTAGAPA